MVLLLLDGCCSLLHAEGLAVLFLDFPEFGGQVVRPSTGLDTLVRIGLSLFAAGTRLVAWGVVVVLRAVSAFGFEEPFEVLVIVVVLVPCQLPDRVPEEAPLFVDPVLVFVIDRFVV